MTTADRLASPTAAAALSPLPPALRIAAIIPCYNEALAIPKVVADFRADLPEAKIHICLLYTSDAADE